MFCNELINYAVKIVSTSIGTSNGSRVNWNSLVKYELVSHLTLFLASLS